MPHQSEIAVVGAGPAGARAAELLAKAGAKVVLLDPKAPWEKPCGGGLTPRAFDDMPELGELRSVARPVRWVRVETGPEEGFTLPLDRPMMVLPREALGRWQLERAMRAGAAHVRAKVSEIRRVYGAWLLRTSAGELSAPFLIGADGAASLVRRVAAPKFDVELAPTRVAYPGGAGPTPDTAVLRFYGGVPGYLWDFPRPDHRSVGIGISNGIWRRPRLDGEIDAHRLSSEGCLCVPARRAGAVIGTAQRGHGDYSRIAAEDFALLGDAAGFADPLTGEGIRNAMRSADLFAAAWREGDVGSYPSLASAAFEREFRAARLLRRFVLESDTGVGLIERAVGSRVWYAVLSAIVNGINEHGSHAGRFLRLWADARRAWPGVPEAPGGGVSPDLCSCGCPETSDRRGVTGAAAVA